ncbi:RDD family protein [Aquihabitans daechungensis]|uniref:RDD family protein n=1 Tax=Aquihabitans daechungensis TaxID=1052257 RepID=UPI003BA39B2E
MSDAPQGPGWWQASDGRWYPPEQSPGYGTPPPYGTPGYGMPPAYGAPAWGVPGPLASWGQRVIAYLVDILIIVVLWVAVFALGLGLGALSEVLGAIVLVLGYVGMIGYQFYIAFMAGKVGGTPGMRLCGLKLVGQSTGQLVGGGTGVLRFVVAWAISTFTCGIGGLLDDLWPLWDDKRQTLHDKAVSTVVLCDQPKESLGIGVFKLS